MELFSKTSMLLSCSSVTSSSFEMFQLKFSDARNTHGVIESLIPNLRRKKHTVLIIKPYIITLATSRATYIYLRQKIPTDTIVCQRQVIPLLSPFLDLTSHRL